LIIKFCLNRIHGADAGLHEAGQIRRRLQNVCYSLFKTLSEWWQFSRCENSARAAAGGTNVVKRTPLSGIAPLHAALLLAARGVPPGWFHSATTATIRYFAIWPMAVLKNLALVGRPGIIIPVGDTVVGVLAQLVERLVRNEKVRSSSLLGSTSLR
jgi:hypothetical protein